MATRRRVRRLRLAVQEDVRKELRRIDVSLKGPTMDVGLLEAADYLAAIARARAPRRTGRLASGIYTANAYRNNHPGGKTAMRLKRPPKPGTAVVVAGVFYQRFYEYGRKRREGTPTKRGVPKQRRRPFFRQALQSGLPGAKAILQRRARRIVEANR